MQTGVFQWRIGKNVSPYTQCSPALDAHWMNKAARIQATSQDSLEPYIHCELVFPDGNSYSITANHQHIHKVQSKNFARNEWQFLDVHLPSEAIYKMQLVVQSMHTCTNSNCLAVLQPKICCKSRI